MHSPASLTSKAYWDGHWEQISNPTIRSNATDPLAFSIINAFSKTLPLARIKRAIEVGGASGGYLAYFTRKFGWDAHVLDVSSSGCRRAIENFQRQRLPVTVHNIDLFKADGSLGKFDLVYSLGLIEHFENVGLVIRAHAKFVESGGYLVFGVPNFMGVYKKILSKLAPNILAMHNLSNLDASNWNTAERSSNLINVGRVYTGGFDPLSIAPVLGDQIRRFPEKSSWILRLIYSIFIGLVRVRTRILKDIPGLRRLYSLNHRIWSSYYLGFYQKGPDQGE
jgi:cyclopropane fatty-acyl-phospholipid synthase-like methyltransferase